MFAVVQVNQDGVITVGDVLGRFFTPLMFPTIATSTAMMAVYWADVNSAANNGRIYYRQITASGQSVTADLDICRPQGRF